MCVIRTRGFVLDGFPASEAHSQYLVERGLFADVLIILKVEDEHVIKRLLPPRFDAWRAKMKLKKEKLDARAKKKKDALAARMKARRDEEMAKYEKRRQERDDNDEEEEEEPFDVEALLQEEFAEELQAHEEEESEEVVDEEIRESIASDIRAQYETQTNVIDAAKDILQEALVPRFTIDAGRKPNIVRYLLEKKLKPFVEHRPSILERVYVLKLKLANRLLDFGYKQLSRFGRWCPVLVSLSP